MRLTKKQIQMMKAQLMEIPDTRKARGKRHSQVTVLMLVICAMLNGNSQCSSIVEWTRKASQHMLKRLGCRYHEDKGRYIPPSEPTIRRALKAIPSAKLEKIVAAWANRAELEKKDKVSAVNEKVLGKLGKESTN